MHSLTLHAHVGSDGILKLETPIGISNAELEIVLMVYPVEANVEPLTEWPADFFTTVVGGWQGAPLAREVQL